ncbi:unnamed protein product [Sphagnum jensenii]|uniref:Cytochrome b5 heme-binding domain-containing protein n=1 Tax=Sphagnum jensenii TaxID=128206 RepID=A0ABP1B362_9BRYO
MEEEKKTFDLKEVAQHKAQDDCWMVIHGKVYDVTKFLDDHPGGDEVLLQTAGTDATDEFDDAGHSDNAKVQMEDFYLGDCAELLKTKDKDVSAKDHILNATESTTESVGILSKFLQFLIPLALFGIAVAIRRYGNEGENVA